MAISDWSPTASNNSDIDGINIAEECAAGNLNNAIRAVMAAVRAGISDFMLTVLDDPDAASARTTLGAAAATAALSSLQALTPAADKLPYFSSDSSASLAAFTSIARTLLAAANANAARDAIGAIGITAMTLANPGYIQFRLSPTQTFMIQWGTISLAKDSAGAVSYSPDFSSFAIPIASATVRLGDDSQQDNSGYATGTSTKTGFTMYNASDFSKVIPWLAVGV